MPCLGRLSPFVIVRLLLRLTGVAGGAIVLRLERPELARVRTGTGKVRVLTSAATANPVFEMPSSVDKGLGLLRADGRDRQRALSGHIKTVKMCVVAQVQSSADNNRMRPTWAAAIDLDFPAQLQALG